MPTDHGRLLLGLPEHRIVNYGQIVQSKDKLFNAYIKYVRDSIH